MAKVRLRPLQEEDEVLVRRAHQQLQAEGFTFALGLRDDGTWTDYLAHLASIERSGESEWVRASLLVADVGGVVVGRASIRYEVNEFLSHEGGHIGYCVVPEERRKGYATQILNQSLVIARRHAVRDVLVTCDADNVGSILVIEHSGGAFENEVHARDGHLVRRYWFREGLDATI